MNNTSYKRWTLRFFLYAFIINAWLFYMVFYRQVDAVPNGWLFELAQWFCIGGSLLTALAARHHKEEKTFLFYVGIVGSVALVAYNLVRLFIL
jgi:cyanate permease